MVKDNFVHKLGQIKEIQNEHNSVKDKGERGKKTSNIDLTFFHENLVSLPTYAYMYMCTFPFI